MSEAVSGAERPVELTHCREFRLSDAMILLAGLALALSIGSHLLLLWADMFVRLWREVTADLVFLPSDWSMFWHATRDPFRNTLWYGFQVAEMFLFGMAPAFSACG